MVSSQTALRLDEIESGKSVDGSIKEDKESEIKKLVSNKQKTSLQWISTIAMIPIETVIEILTEDPDFIIEYEYVVNKKLLMKEEIAKRICSICKTPFEPSHEFCANCGNVLK